MSSYIPCQPRFSHYALCKPVWWHRPIIPAPWESDTETLHVQAQPDQFRDSETSSNKNLKRAEDVAQCKGPGFKTQYHKKKSQNESQQHNNSKNSL